MNEHVLSIWRGDMLMPKNRPGMAVIAQSVAEKHGLRLKDLIGDERSRTYSRPRQEAYYAIYQTGAYSLPQIGRFFGGRDHTTVLFGIRAHEKRMAAL